MKINFNRGVMIPVILVSLMLLALFAGKPEIVPQMAYKKPVLNHLKGFTLFGFSPLGEKMTSLMAWGYWQTVSVAIFGRMLAVVLSLLGLLIAWMARSWGFVLLSRLSESLMTIPSLLLALSLGYLVGEGFITMIVVIAVSEWSFNQKWLLGRLNEYKRFTFVSASKTIGAGHWHIFRTHFFSFITSDLTFLFFLYLPGSLLTVASLEFLGLSSGTEISGLGSIIALNKDLIFLYPHIIMPPVILIVLTVFAAIVIKNNIPGRDL